MDASTAYALPRMSPKNAAIRFAPRFIGPTIGVLRNPAWAWNDQCTHPVAASRE